MTERPLQKLVPSITFAPAFVCSTAAFYWAFALLRSHAFASSLDSMSMMFESTDQETSVYAWSQFSALYSPGLTTFAGLLGVLGSVSCVIFFLLRFRLLQNCTAQLRASDGFNMDASPVCVPKTFWQESWIRLIIGSVLIAISCIVGVAERNRDAFEIAQTQLLYPDVQWYSNIEFTIGLIGCFVLSSVAFLWSRLHVVAVEEDSDYAVNELEEDVRKWELALKR